MVGLWDDGAWRVLHSYPTLLGRMQSSQTRITIFGRGKSEVLRQSQEPSSRDRHQSTALTRKRRQAHSRRWSDPLGCITGLSCRLSLVGRDRARAWLRNGNWLTSRSSWRERACFHTFVAYVEGEKNACFLLSSPAVGLAIATAVY